MLWLSKNDLKNFFGEVAKELNVSEWEWLFHSELIE